MSLLAVVLVRILRVTLQRAIGLKSLGVFGDLFLGIRLIFVWLKQLGSPSLLRMSRHIYILEEVMG